MINIGSIFKGYSISVSKSEFEKIHLLFILCELKSPPSTNVVIKLSCSNNLKKDAV